MNFSSSSPGAGEAMAGEVGGGERVCLLPAHKEAFSAELTLQTQEACRQPASLSRTGPQSSNFRDPLCSLRCWQLLSLVPGCTVTPGMVTEGIWGAWRRGGFAAFPAGLARTASVRACVGTNKPRPGLGGGDVSGQPSPLPSFVQAAGEGEGGRRAGAVGLPQQV